jgi:hypothetical protein
LQIELDDGDNYHVDQAVRWALGRIAELEAAAHEANRTLAEERAAHTRTMDRLSLLLTEAGQGPSNAAALLAEQPGGGK